MSVVSVHEMADSPTGGLGWKGTDFERYFAVVVNNYADGSIIVCQAVDPNSSIAIPARGDTYSTSTEEHEFAICKNVKAKRVGPRHLTWIVTVRYETIESSQHAQSVAQEVAAWADPLAEIADIKIKSEIYQEPVWGEIDPDTNETTFAITNSVGELISPPFTRDKTRLILTISRNEAATEEHVDEIFALSVEYMNTINSDEFWGQAPHVAKINAFDIDRVSRTVGETGELVVFLRVTYTIHFQDPDWDVRPLDNGPNFIDPREGTTNTPAAFTSKTGHPYRGLLNGGGNPLGDVDATTGAVGPVTSDTPPVFLGPFQIYQALPFAELDLPINILGEME